MSTNLLSDVSAFFDHVEIGLTREEVHATKDADAPADDSLSDRANRQANIVAARSGSRGGVDAHEVR